MVQPTDIPLYDHDDGEVTSSLNAGSGAGFPGSSVAGEPYHVAKDRIVAQFEKEYLTALVARATGNMSKAARMAGVDRTTLYRLMEKHQLVRTNSEELAG